MSPLALFIAKLVGLMFLVFSLLMAMNKRAMLAAIDELVRSRGLMLIAGSFNLAAGLAIILGHNGWSGGVLTIVVTLIGGWLGSRNSGLCFRQSASGSFAARSRVIAPVNKPDAIGEYTMTPIPCFSQ
jgi:hypothetical protein